MIQVPSSPAPAPVFRTLIPNEVLPVILRYADPSSLARCMRVSKTFYQVAGPLLYSNVIVKGSQPISNALIGESMAVHKLRATRRHPASDGVNLKKRLLSLVQQLTVASHTCTRTLIPAETFPNLKTLLVIPDADCWMSRLLCGNGSFSCPILAGARPEKVVIHNSRASHHAWPMCREWIYTTSPTLTLVLDEAKCGTNGLPHQAHYRGVVWTKVRELRIIVSKSPPWIGRIVPKVPCPSTVIDIPQLATRLLAPLLEGRAVPITIYLFRDFEERGESLLDLTDILDKDLEDRHQDTSDRWWRQGLTFKGNARPDYTIKRLGDYISEGVEDEFLWQELQYWRREHMRRMEKAEERDVGEIDDSI